MEKSFAKKGISIVGVLLVLYAALVSTHEGEFWPFSIYPMFSQAGNPWTRAMVLDVSNLPANQIWETSSLYNQSVNPIPLKDHGIDQIDFSSFISKTENWTPERLEALHHMFGKVNLASKQWIAAKVRGELVNEDSVVVEIQPFLLVTADTVRMNPNLDRSAYFKGELE